jgi:hypothetical protein
MEEWVPMSFFQAFSFSSRGKQAQGRKKGAALPKIEAFEDRLLPSTISGFVYNDANLNGLFDAGETPIAHSPIQLRDASNQVIGTTVTDANGFYQFTTNPLIDTSPTTQVHTITFPDTPTDWSVSQGLPQFDPSLGTLTSVEIISNDTTTSTIKVENIDSSPATIHATVQGTITLTGPNVAGLTDNLSADQSFNASAFDGTVDFGGTSGHNFGPQTAQGTKTITLTSASDMAPYIGTGTVNLNEVTHAGSTATGSANLLVSINTTAGGTVRVIYHYIPSNTLGPGNYTIVQLADPPGYFDGQTTRGNVTPIPNSIGSNMIPVTLTTGDSVNNDFGEVKPASIYGFVYLDKNNNGAREVGEPGIGGATVTLTGINDAGQTVHQTQVTAPNGLYDFVNLRPGTYTITETQPAGYLDGKDSMGTQGGTAGNDQFTNINLQPGVVGRDNNFGELLPASLSGFVYVDGNNNGVREPGEAPIAGNAVTLTGVNDLGQAINLTHATDANGYYIFANLRPGTYTISQSEPAGFLDGKDAIGSQGGVAGNDQFSAINLAQSTNGTNNNFGEIRSSILYGYVYFDVAKNGVRDPGDPGIGGVVVTLTGVDDQGHQINRTMTTNPDGLYMFSNLRPGQYTITKTPPANFLDGADSLGSLGGLQATNQFFGINLGSGIIGRDYNFGEIVPSTHVVPPPPPPPPPPPVPPDLSKLLFLASVEGGIT